MKAAKTAALLMLAALALSGCSSGGELEYDAKIVRADGSAGDMEFPASSFIRSLDELESYLAKMGERLNVSAARDELAECDEEYFKSHSLAAIALREPSAGVTHSVEGVESKGGVITVSVMRYPPAHASASVMTQWLIFVELPAQSGTPEIKVALDTKNPQ